MFTYFPVYHTSAGIFELRTYVARKCFDYVSLYVYAMRLAENGFDLSIVTIREPAVGKLNRVTCSCREITVQIEGLKDSLLSLLVITTN